MASHAHSIRMPLLRQSTGSAGLLSSSLLSSRIVAADGPVTRALAAITAADPDFDRIRALRRSIAARIEADIALLDALAGDPDFEDGGDDEDGHDAEGDTDDNGVADGAGAWDQYGSDHDLHGFVVRA